MPFKSTAGVYAIVQIGTDQAYVGSTINLADRGSHHFASLRRGDHDNRRLQQAWAEHGATAFVFHILEYVVDPARLTEREQYWIDTRESANPAKGFNIAPTAGNQNGFRHSIATRTVLKMQAERRMSDPERRARLVQVNTGKRYGESTRLKHALSMQGSKAPGAKLREEDIPIIRASLAAGETVSSIARRYQVDRCAIKRIKYGRGWLHVPIS